MNKSELRKLYLQKRKSLSDEKRDEISLDIANQVLQLPIWEKDYYHIFLPIASKFEVNTEYIINILAGKDKHILLPKSDFINLTLKHILLTDSTLIKMNDYGIPEPGEGIEIYPEKIENVFLPLLAFDVEGNRVGYGKGFYDRFLNECKPDTIKIGLSMFNAELKINDVSNYDVKLDYCVTPDKIYRFG